MSAAPRTRGELLRGSTSRADGRALARLLAAQQLSLACDEQVLGSPVLRRVPVSGRLLVETIAHAERAHVAATHAALERRDGPAVTAPHSDAELDHALARHRIPGRPARLRGPRDAFTLLVDVERAAIGAAYVALSRLHDAELSALVAAMMASDAQHEALLALAAHPGDVAGAIPFGVVEGIA